MRVNNGFKKTLSLDNYTINKKSSGIKDISSNNTFKARLSEVNKQEVREKLHKLLVLIDEKGEKLKKSLDEKTLLEYKQYVKDFLKTIQNEFANTKQSFSWDGNGNLKTYTIIEKIDNNLNSLHDMFMKEQTDVLNVLSRIKEIKGLLLDLYV
ncbi:MAG: YaaR family protein [bacterium]